MKKLLFITMLLCSFFTSSIYCQTSKDLFYQTDQPIYWLGVDYSHVKLIGTFAQFAGSGETDISELKNKYFPSWNRLILAEPEKYDIKGMFRKNTIINDIEMIIALNQKADISSMEVFNEPNYTNDTIQYFVNEYPIENKSGIGIIFIAETLDKNSQTAFYFVVAINMNSKEILFCERMMGKPAGFGLRNYWAGSIYYIIKNVKRTYYNVWQSKYSK